MWQDKSNHLHLPRFYLLKPSYASSVCRIRGSHVVKSHHAFHVASSSLLKLPHHGLQSSHATLQINKDSRLEVKLLQP